uniref:Uncharacterized protein n=1 Tax=Panagrolaimus superbus TaxID=310955 RepID=A0A914Z907_9BILA
MGEWEGVPSISQVFRLCPKWMIIATFIIIVLGFTGAAAATYSAILELSTTSFQKPCYFFSTQPNNEGHTNCCGENQTISRYNDPNKCSKPDRDYYT